jgi:rhodanese-related sulfurtransferase
MTLEEATAVFERKAALFVDARRPEAYREGHIPGAINFPYDRVGEMLDDFLLVVPLDSAIVCYCWSVSHQLARELRMAGYTRVRVYDGGWLEWSEADRPKETGPGRAWRPEE